MARLERWLFSELDAAALAVFRVVLGGLVSVSALRFIVNGWIPPLFETRFRFSYWGFGWVPHPGTAGVYALFSALVVLGVLVGIGLLYRLSVLLLFVCFTWLQLLDVANYLNHYYLVSLLLLLASVMPLHRLWSVDAWLRPSLRSEVLPAWCTALLRFQVGIVYVFAGLAKLNSDWLVHGVPLQLWLSARTSAPLIGPWLGLPHAALLMSWGGFLFDSTVPLFLSWRRARPYAYVVVVGFHAATWALFPIGMFPFIMTLSALVFFDASWPRRWLRLSPPATSADPRAAKRWVLAFLGAWAVVQLALPLRTHLFGGEVSWHEQGMRFSWRVMTREKNGSVTYRVRQRSTGREWHVSPGAYLTRIQERELAVQPDLILQLAHHIGATWPSPDVEVFADALASWNGRPATRLIDERINLLDVHDGLAPATWVLDAPTVPPLSAAR
ncbi:MAG: HTTM domain-containing protein [Archangium sp.]|nr:HTTM domain-containing protein [Archangium sp.]